MTKVFVQQHWLYRILNNNGAGKTICKENGIKKALKLLKTVKNVFNQPY